jgi:hypothetical protein
MAKASVKFKQVVNPIESMTITINQQEVETLIAILRRIGGCPDNSPRKHAGSILEAIEDSLVGTVIFPPMTDLSDLIDNTMRHNAIYFENYKKESK